MQGKKTRPDKERTKSDNTMTDIQSIPAPDNNLRHQRAIMRASVVSIIGNAVLAVAKLVIGFLGGSFAVVSDGIDSASDVAISVVIAVTAKIMARKPNRKYVYGYAKAESIATKILSLFIFFAGAQMFISAVRQLFLSLNFRNLRKSRYYTVSVDIAQTAVYIVLGIHTWLYVVVFAGQLGHLENVVGDCGIR